MGDGDEFPRANNKDVHYVQEADNRFWHCYAYTSTPQTLCRRDWHYALHHARFSILDTRKPARTPHTQNRAGTDRVLFLQHVYTIAYYMSIACRQRVVIPGAQRQPLAPDPPRCSVMTVQYLHTLWFRAQPQIPVRHRLSSLPFTIHQQKKVPSQ